MAAAATDHSVMEMLFFFLYNLMNFWHTKSPLSLLCTFIMKGYAALAHPDLCIYCWVILLCQRFHRIRPTDLDDHIMTTSSAIHLSLVGKLQPLFPHKCNQVENSIRGGKVHNWYLTHSKCRTVCGPESSLSTSWGRNETWFFLHGL